MSEIEKYKNRNRTLRIDKMSLLKTIERRNDEIKQLKSQLQQKENIIKEVRKKLRELVEDDGTFIGEINYLRKKELLEILDKGE